MTKEELKNVLRYTENGSKAALFTLFVLTTKGVDLGINFKYQPTMEDMLKALDNMIDYILRDLDEHHQNVLSWIIDDF